MNHVHLHVHSEYSLLDGVSPVEELVARAKENESPAMALTEHGVITSEYQLYAACDKFNIKPILGVELYVLNPFLYAQKSKKKVLLGEKPESGANCISYEIHRDLFHNANKEMKMLFHLVVWAISQKGIANLHSLVSKAHQQVYYKPVVTLSDIAACADGLASSTGCLAAEIPSLLAADEIKHAENLLEHYRQIFGGRFYVELQEHNLPELRKVNQELLRLSNEKKIPVLITTDAHYAREEQKSIQDALLRLSTFSPKQQKENDTDVFSIRGNWYSLLPPQEIINVFSPIYGEETTRQASENTLSFASEVKYQRTIPVSYQLPSVSKDKRTLRDLVMQGAKTRYGERLPEVLPRIEYELQVIERMGFEDYFLILFEMKEYMESQGELWNVRGSGGGSVVLYALGISHIDPLYHNLLFERFLNPDRISMPDVDIDVSDVFRPKIVRYFEEKYGREKIARILTFGTLQVKAAIREVLRIHGVSPANINQVSKKIPDSVESVEQLLENDAFMKEMRHYENYQEILAQAKSVQSKKRQFGIHPAGIVIAPEPIESYTAYHRASSEEEEGILPVQLDMNGVETAKLIKMDVLGVRTLRIISLCLKLISQRTGQNIKFQDIPINDPEAYEIYLQGNTTGIFQVSSEEMRKILMKIAPQNIFHIVAAIALYRPGPQAFIPLYQARKAGEERVEYPHPILKPILEETFGIFIYQEQIMQAVSVLAGFSGAEADTLRRAISKKDPQKMASYRQKFIENAARLHKLEEKTCAFIWDEQIVPFTGYGFNKAHASSYAELSVKTAWLKRHYPIEFFLSAINSEIEQADKVSLYVNDCRRNRIRVLPPDINLSDELFKIEGENLRFGLIAIKHIRKDAVERIIQRRNQTGEYRSVSDFLFRNPDIDNRTCAVLLASGAFDSLHNGSRTSASREIPDKVLESLTHGILPDIPSRDWEWVLYEPLVCGVYVSKHPLKEYLAANSHKKTEKYTPADLLPSIEKHEITTIGIASDVFYQEEKRWLFFEIEGIATRTKIAAFGDSAERVKGLQNGDIVLINAFRNQRGWNARKIDILSNIRRVH